MEEIKEIILSHCKGIAYPEFELEDLNVMVKEINDHYTNEKSQELIKAKEELRTLPRAVIEECMRHLLELSRGSASSSSFHFVISQLNIFKNQIHNSTPPETLSQISAIIKTNKSQAKEIEGLKEALRLIKEYSMGFGVYSDVALMACDPRCNKIMDKCEELLKEVK